MHLKTTITARIHRRNSPKKGDVVSPLRVYLFVFGFFAAGHQL